MKLSVILFNMKMIILRKCPRNALLNFKLHFQGDYLKLYRIVLKYFLRKDKKDEIFSHSNTSFLSFHIMFILSFRIKVISLKFNQHKNLELLTQDVKSR